MAITVAMRTEISQLYVALFGRAPDGEGLGFWVGLRDQGQSLTQIANTMYGTTPARAYFPSFLTNGEIISSFYVNVLGRTADAEGLAFWTAQLNATGATPGSVIATMINTVANYTGTDAAGLTSQSLFNNKVTVAQYYGEHNGTIAGATTVLSSVTAVAASVTTAIAAIDGGNVGGVNQGQTFVLTSATDVLSGTTGNDTYIAGLGAAGVATMTGGDTISGGAGTDRINLFGNGNAAAFTSASVSGVEQVHAQFSASGAALNVSGNADVLEAWVNKADLSDNAAGTATVTAKKAQTVGIEGTTLVNATDGNTALTFTFTDVAGAADAATLALNAAVLAKTGTGTAGVTIAGVETLNIAATGTSSIGTLTAAATTTLNVSGAGKVTATAAGGTFKTVNASTNTGGLVLDISALAAADLAVTGGSGADEITVDYTNLTKLDVINLGAGTDTLGFSVTNVALNDAASAALFAGVSNVEAMKFNGAITATVDASLTAISGFTVNSTGVAALSNLVNADAVTIGAVTAGANTFAIELGSNTLNLTLAGSATAHANATTQQVVTGSSIVNVSSTGTAGVANNVLDIKSADNNLYNVTGSQNLTLTVTGVGGVTGQTVDASAFSGKLTVTSTALADVVKGGSGADTITAGAGADIITGGAGKDTFVMNTGDIDTTLGVVTDTITDFVSGTDVLKITTVGAAGSATNYLEASAAVVDLATLLTAADAALNGTVKVYVGQVGSDSYVVTDADGTGYTEVIKLTGVALTGIAFADIVA